MIITTGILMVILYITWVYSRRLPSIPLILGGYEGANYSQDRGATTRTLLFKTRGGIPIKIPLFAASAQNLVYWSQNDNALCWIRNEANNKPVWITVNLPPLSAVRGIRLASDAVLLNLCNASYKRIGVLRLDLHSRRLELLKDWVEARATAESPDIAGLRADGFVEVRHQDTSRILGKMDGDAMDWDCDPLDPCFCFTDGRRLTLVRGDETTSWNTLTLTFVHCVFLSRTSHRVWVTAGWPFSSGSELLAYDYASHYLGSGLHTVFPIRGPLIVDEDTIHFVTKALSGL